MSDVEVSETCRCGASTTVKGLDRRDAADSVAAWRAGHRCIPADTPAKDTPQRTGAGTTLGFRATDMDGPYGSGWPRPEPLA